MTPPAGSMRAAAPLDSRVVRVAHCDWGRSPKKRRLAIADHRQDGTWVAKAIADPGCPGTLLARLQSDVAADAGALFVGFDFPIGVPLAYAHAAHIASFVRLLSATSDDEWSRFVSVCESSDEVSLKRPFYPWNGHPKGSTSRARQYAALKLDRAALLRECEQLTGAEVLFWTLGPKQVGKGAMIGWTEVLRPAVGTFHLWPFAGPLAELLVPGHVVVAEAYPAEFYKHLGVRVVKSKRESRASAAERLIQWASANDVALGNTLIEQLRSGFETDDDFDALVGLFGIINMLRGHRPEGYPERDHVRRIEGWILGAGD